MFFPYWRIWVIISHRIQNWYHISLEVPCMAMPLGSQHRTGTKHNVWQCWPWGMVRQNGLFAPSLSVKQWTRMTPRKFLVYRTSCIHTEQQSKHQEKNTLLTKLEWMMEHDSQWGPISTYPVDIPGTLRAV